MQLLRALDKWTQTLDIGGEMDVIYLDFRKAFDTVPHRRLLKKISGYDIQDNVLRWIENFLTGRKQRLGVNEVFSDWTSENTPPKKKSHINFIHNGSKGWHPDTYRKDTTGERCWNID
ncbi:hypothetical protein Pmani_002042 [Petrolisthes manimaculis]|uniref:Reverse transcriptase domain-containing protein n=1 Tax=Petrolisthes manimaculis TaxID=1843537 RepID=A0AAE1UNU3_9EUCA|nr:hypothetical protein Pmani_002042 [Petrolisthes manimaculis]